MSFRLRVFLLVAVVAFVSTGATAWLTLHQATEQIAETASADQHQVATIVDRLVDYGRSHNGWDGVGTLIREMSEETGQRIRITTQTGAPVADSDVLASHVARPAPEPAFVVDARLAPSIVMTADPGTAATLLAAGVVSYRVAARMAGCLTEHGAPVELTVLFGSLVVTMPDQQHPALEVCRASTSHEELDAAQLAPAFEQCLSLAPVPAQECLERAYSTVIATFAPPPLRLQIGAVDTRPAGLAAAPIAAAAGALLLVVVTGAGLLSRRVLRPIAALMAASACLGAGDLSQRVPVSGRDELAALARSFNRMADSLRDSEERQRRLVADVAHELRTPLSNLRGYLEALQDGVMPADPATLRSLHDEVMLQQRIVDDLQDFALADAGQLAYQRGHVDLVEVAAQCVIAHQPTAESAGVRLGLDHNGPSGVPSVAHAVDADRIRQALGNLIGNAVRATPAGGAVTLFLSSTLDGRVELRVADTGAGIEAADLPNIFDRFWRGDNARSRRTGGSGLGLAIARQIVLDHGGTIAAESTPGVGTTVTIRLPSGSPA